jgi:hypothetical protein
MNATSDPATYELISVQGAYDLDVAAVALAIAKATVRTINTNYYIYNNLYNYNIQGAYGYTPKAANIYRYAWLASLVIVDW